MSGPQTLKGFRDFLARCVKKRDYIKNVLKNNFEKYGFEPLETPALEYDELLSGKYGEEGDKLMYRFTDNGGRKVAMRYDQTVPLARVIATNRDLPLPYKRYQMQLVWRAENPQKGRFREFLQCDADTLGVDSPLADAELIALAADGLLSLGFNGIRIRINDRSLFNELNLTDGQLSSFLTSLDKLQKIGSEKVREELISKDIDPSLLDTVRGVKPSDYILTLKNIIKSLGINSEIIFDPTLARGLDYYTSLIFEIELEGYSAGSVCGGGRYNNLVDNLAGIDIPAAGFAYGFDRILEAMDEQNLFPTDIDNSTTQVLITVFDNSTLDSSLKAARLLRDEGVNTQIYEETGAKLAKQLKYANKKNIPHVVIIGPEEAKENKATLKNLTSGQEKTVPLDTLPDELD